MNASTRDSTVRQSRSVVNGYALPYKSKGWQQSSRYESPPPSPSGNAKRLKKKIFLKNLPSMMFAKLCLVAIVATVSAKSVKTTTAKVLAETDYQVCYAALRVLCLYILTVT